MNDIKLIVSDLDNTLLNSNRSITGYTAKILTACKEKGIKLAFATARPERMTKLIQSQFIPDYIIADNGAMIYENGEAINKLFIPHKSKNQLIKELLIYSEIIQISVDTIDSCLSNYYNNSDETKNWWIAWNGKFNNFETEVFEDSPKISAECSDAELFISILNKYADLNYCANSGENWFQVMHKNASKINGIKFVCQKLNITLENVVAFGDDYNDIEMLKECRVGVAVANSANEIKNQVKQICDTNDNDGVAKWIEKNIFNG